MAFLPSFCTWLFLTKKTALAWSQWQGRSGAPAAVVCIYLDSGMSLLLAQLTSLNMSPDREGYKPGK